MSSCRSKRSLGEKSNWEFFKKQRQEKLTRQKLRQLNKEQRCENCLQLESEIQITAFDVNAVEERSFTDDITEFKNYKITEFVIYDSFHHMCQLDWDLVEKDLKCYLTGYVSSLDSNECEMAIKNIGPITEWWLSYDDDDDDEATIGISTEFGYYFLMTPSDEYRVYYFPLKEKSVLTSIVIKCLEENENMSYKTLIERIEAKTPLPDYEDDIELTEGALHRHAEFILDQIASYDDSADDFDPLFMRSKCIQDLKELSGKVLLSRRKKFSSDSKAIDSDNFYQRKNQVEFWKHSRKKPMLKSVNTRLVNRIFSSIFEGYIESVDSASHENSDNESLSDDDNLHFEDFDHQENDLVVDYGDNKCHVDFCKEITCKDGTMFFQDVEVNGKLYEIGDCVFISLDSGKTMHLVRIALITFNEAKQFGRFHGILLIPGSETILGKAASENEYFLTNRCRYFSFSKIICKSDIIFKPQLVSDWNMVGGKDLEEQLINAEGRRLFYSKFYFQNMCRFVDIPEHFIEFNATVCPNSLISERKNEDISLGGCQFSETGGLCDIKSVDWQNTNYGIGNAVFLLPNAFRFDAVLPSTQKEKPISVDKDVYTEYYRKEQVKIISQSPYRIGIIKEIYAQSLNISHPDEVKLRIQKFYRPENTHLGAKASYEADYNLLYWSDEEVVVPLFYIVGKCKVIYSQTRHLPDFSYERQIFYFNETYDAATQSFSSNENYYFSIPVQEIDEEPEAVTPLKTMDVFCGCGGLSEGLQQSGISKTYWAIDNDKYAAQAFKKNHPDCNIYKCDANSFLCRVMDEKQNENLPKKGDVELLCGGPPCQGFSGLNKFRDTSHSKMKKSLITTQLSLCDWYRPRFFLLENVYYFMYCDKNMILKSTLRCLLAMGYQCTFGVLAAGNYGVPQSRKRVFLLAAAPGERLPQFPAATHVSQNKLPISVTICGMKLFRNSNCCRSAPYRSVKVGDAIRDLEQFYDGSSQEVYNYKCYSQSHYQRMARAKIEEGHLYDHSCNYMNPLMEKRISLIPKVFGADWRDLPNIELTLRNGVRTKKLQYPYEDYRNGYSKTGVCPCAEGRREGIVCSVYRQTNTLIAWWMVHTANANNQWNGVYGRLHYNDVFPVTITSIKPSGKIGRIIHPAQDRILSTRECARSQGFPDSYRFIGPISEKQKQIGNAVPPILACVIGCEIKKSILNG